MGEVLRNPIYSTGVGLLLYGKRQWEENLHAQPVRKNTDGGMGDAIQKLRGWFARNF
jgi:cell division protein FtsA